MNGSQGTFVGRDADIAAVVRHVCNPRVKVLCILGETGTGKTALAGHVMDQLPKQRFELDPIREVAFRPRESGTSGNWSKGLEDWLVLAVAQQIWATVPSKMTRDEQVGRILAAVKKRRTLLLLDNAETLDQEWLRKLASDWLENGGESLLLITTTKDLALKRADASKYKVHLLEGLTDPEAILTLLGGEMRSRVADEAALLNAGRKVRGIPQQLKYLGWSEARSVKELNELANSLKATNAPRRDIGKIIKRRIRGTVTHFLALGRVRTIKIHESLFAHLWDRLGGGSMEEYIAVREQLIAEGFLSRVRKEGTELQVHPSVHIQAEKHLARHIGKEHISHVDYYLSEYYRERMSSCDGISDLATLGSYVYHAIQSDNLISAMEYLLSASHVRSMHHKGMAIGLAPILTSVDGDVANRMETVNRDLARYRRQRNAEKVAKAEAEQKTLTRLWSLLKVELAHCANDLSMHQKCLDYLDKAEGMLSQGQEDARVRQDINYLRGVSHSDLGRSGKCIEAYTDLVRSQVSSGTINERGILALGYLAFEYRFTDPASAESLGQEALRLGREHGDLSIIAKSDCSLAQTLFFKGKIDAAEKCFKEAEDMCRNDKSGRPDRRELGRVLTHRAMTDIYRGNYVEARTRLKESREINAESGDRRRLATSKALLGICSWRQSNEFGIPAKDRKVLAEEGRRLLAEAIQEHISVEDWRDATWEALSYAHIAHGYANSEIALDAARAKPGRVEAWMHVLLGAAPTTSCELFRQYWDSSIRRYLLRA